MRTEQRERLWRTFDQKYAGGKIIPTKAGVAQNENYSFSADAEKSTGVSQRKSSGKGGVGYKIRKAGIIYPLIGGEGHTAKIFRGLGGRNSYSAGNGYSTRRVALFAPPLKVGLKPLVLQRILLKKLVWKGP